MVKTVLKNKHSMYLGDSANYPEAWFSRLIYANRQILILWGAVVCWSQYSYLVWWGLNNWACACVIVSWCWCNYQHCAWERLSLSPALLSLQPSDPTVHSLLLLQVIHAGGQAGFMAGCHSLWEPWCHRLDGNNCTVHWHCCSHVACTTAPELPWLVQLSPHCHPRYCWHQGWICLCIPRGCFPSLQHSVLSRQESLWAVFPHQQWLIMLYWPVLFLTQGSRKVIPMLLQSFIILNAWSVWLALHLGQLYIFNYKCRSVGCHCRVFVIL